MGFFSFLFGYNDITPDDNDVIDLHSDFTPFSDDDDSSCFSSSSCDMPIGASDLFGSDAFDSSFDSSSSFGMDDSFGSFGSDPFGSDF